MKKPTPLTVASAIFLLALIVLLTREWLHMQRVKENSDYRFTIVEIMGDYEQGEAVGKSIRYLLDSTQYDYYCTGKECNVSKMGERYIIKVYLDDPTVFYIYFNKGVVENNVMPPPEGWKTFPTNVRFSVRYN